MFDFSFGELVVCLLVALIVLGPEKLHVVITTLGRWSGRARVYMRNLTAELEQETQAAELKRQLEDTQRMLREQAEALRSGASNLHKEVKDAVTPESPKPPEPEPSPDKTEPDAPPPPGKDARGQ